MRGSSILLMTEILYFLETAKETYQVKKWALPHWMGPRLAFPCTNLQNMMPSHHPLFPPPSGEFVHPMQFVLCTGESRLLRSRSSLDPVQTRRSVASPF